MVNYEYGKIYKITSEKSGLVYYGSTSEYYLCQRLSGHRSQYKNYLNGKGKYNSSFELLKCEDYKMELIKNFPCNNKTQLTTEEGKYVINNQCININIPGRTGKEYKEDNKEHYQEYKKQWYDQNKQKIKEQKSKPYQCECGMIIQWCEKARHFKTKKHCKYINTRLH